MARIASLILLPSLILFLPACGGGNTTNVGGPTGLVTSSLSFPPPWAEAKLIGNAGTQTAVEASVNPNLMGMSRIRGVRWPFERDSEPIDPTAGLPQIAPPEQPPPTVQFRHTVSCRTVPVECEAAAVGRQGSLVTRAGSQGGVPDKYGIAHAQWSSLSDENRVVFPDASGIGVMESLDFKSAPRTDDPASRSWGAWMEHSGFATTGAWTIEPPRNDAQYGHATAWAWGRFAGELTGSSPQYIEGRSIWNGVMTGMHMGVRGNNWTPLTGKATLTWNHDNNEIDAAFTGIRSLVRGPAWTGISRIDFPDIEVDSNGRFGWMEDEQGKSRSLPESYIQGAFFGPAHDEVAGVFEQRGVVGAFGTRREEPKTEETPDPEPETIVLGDVLIAAQGQLFRADSMCRGSTCTVTFQGESVTVDLRDVDPDGADVTVTGQSTRNGVQTGRATASEDGFDFSTFGVWGEHNVGTPLRGSTTVDGVSIEFAFPASLGTGSGSNPVSGNAIWTGAMAGVKVGGFSLGAEVTGDAVMTVDLAAADLDLALTNIADTSGARSDDIRWTGVSMRDGSFSGIGGLDGRFYGPNHEEAGGVFERDDIAGAFSLARQ